MPEEAVAREKRPHHKPMKTVKLSEYICESCNLPALTDLNGQCEFCRNRWRPDLKDEFNEIDIRLILAVAAFLIAFAFWFLG